jgi:hypothetical protein
MDFPAPDHKAGDLVVLIKGPKRPCMRTGWHPKTGEVFVVFSVKRSRWNDHYYTRVVGGPTGIVSYRFRKLVPKSPEFFAGTTVTHKTEDEHELVA